MASRVLFHGTTTKFLRPIQKAAAILPRERTGRAVYDGELASRPDRVYLSDVYAVQFGLLAVERHGGNLLVCRAVVDDSLLLPDDDFQEGGKHHLKFPDSEWAACLDQTGCVSVRGPAAIDRLYVVKGKELKELLANRVRIHTGFMHRGLREQMARNFEAALWGADRKTFNGERWCA